MTDDSVTLAPHELLMGAEVGVRRHTSAIQANRADRHGIDPGDGWRAHIEGALGELAVARYCGKYWDGSVDTFRSSPDLANVEVRTRSRHDYDLIIRNDDDPDKFYVLVTGRAPTYRIRGWIKGANARRDDWLQTHGNRPAAWFVPNSALTPIAKPA